ncbi:hypothetical protein [Streptomyces halstedii]
MAAVSASESWLFDRVNRRANNLAHHLIGLRFVPNARAAAAHPSAPLNS